MGIFQQAYTSAVTKASEWSTQLVDMLPNIVLAVIILIIFYFIAKYAKKGVQRAGRNLSDNQALNKLLGTITYVVIIFFGLFIALGVMNLDKAVTSLLAGAGIVGLALGFAFQDIAANFISGVIIAITRPFKIGDVVESNSYQGTIRKINLRSTEIETFQGNQVLLPNKQVFGNPLINYSEKGERRVDLELGVSYEDNLEKVKEVAINTIEDLDFVEEDRGVELFYTEFGGSSIKFSLRFWINYAQKQASFLDSKSQAIMAIKQAFNENDIEIPYPITTLDFGEFDIPEIFGE